MNRANYPACYAHDQARCFKCGGQLRGEPKESGYPVGQFKDSCRACGLFTWYDVKSGEELAEYLAASPLRCNQ